MLAPGVVVAAHGWAAWRLWTRGRGGGDEDAPRPVVTLAAVQRTPDDHLPGGGAHAEEEEGKQGKEATSSTAAAATAAPPPPVDHPLAALVAPLLAQPPPLAARPRAPLPLASTPCQWVDTPPRLAAAAMQLYEEPRVALDAEHHARHSYQGLTCLLQLSTGGWVGWVRGRVGWVGGVGGWVGEGAGWVGWMGWVGG